MLVKMFPTNNAAHHQLPAEFAVISHAQLEQSVADFKRGFETHVRNAQGDTDDQPSSSGKRLTDAVQRRLATPRAAFRAPAATATATTTTTASSDADDESFTKKLSDATKRAADRRPHSQCNVAEQSKRLGYLKPRPQTKSD
jgi:hypothetical protein